MNKYLMMCAAVGLAATAGVGSADAKTGSAVIGWFSNSFYFTLHWDQNGLYAAKNVVTGFAGVASSSYSAGYGPANPRKKVGKIALAITFLDHFGYQNNASLFVLQTPLKNFNTWEIVATLSSNASTAMIFNSGVYTVGGRKSARQPGLPEFIKTLRAR